LAAVTSGFGEISLGNKNLTRFNTVNDLPFLPIRPSASASTMANNTANNDHSISMSGEPPNESKATPHIGSKAKPNIIVVDGEFPERNGEFDVQYVQGIALQGSKRNGWHIHIGISMEDSKLWSAVIHSGRDPALAHRMILIKGPARAAWLTEYAAFGKKIKCEATTEYHQETVAKIAIDDNRRVKYWLLVFPKGTYFDNVALSGDPFRININIHGIVWTFDASKRAEFCTITTHWGIADKFGGWLLETEKEKEINYNDTF
jgi:hypothetical protein